VIAAAAHAAAIAAGRLARPAVVFIARSFGGRASGVRPRGAHDARSHGAGRS
jgi:hypothetical protein